MDPASIIGIVAAACQFAELAAKGAIKGAGLLKSLRDTPAKLTELLRLVQISKQNMVQLRDHLAHPTLLSLLPQLQLQSFRDDIDQAHKIAEELEVQIESLVGPTTQDLRGIKKLWRDVITIKKEGEFNDRFEAIQRYNEQIHRGLSGLQVALSTKNLESSVAIGTRVNQNTTVLAEIKDKVYELNSRKTDVDIDVNVHGSTLIAAQQTRASPATTRVEFELRLEPVSIRDEIRSELMLLMTGQGPYASASNALLPIVSRLSHEDRAQVTSMLLMTQAQHANNPRRHSNSAAVRRSFDWHSAPWPPLCDCDIKTYNIEKTFKRGPFSFGYGYENQKRHHTSCPYNGGEAVKQTWNYRLCMQLLPLVNKTVQFALSATIGGDGLELQFPLKVFPTVQRANSAIFMLFDNFAERCAELGFFRGYYVNQRLYPQFLVHGVYPIDNEHDSNTAVAWDIDRVRQELRHIRRVLCDAHVLRIGSIRDRDESGFTVLHELMLLVLQLIPVYSHVVDEITGLLKLISVNDIDAHCVTEGEEQILDSQEQPYLPLDFMLGIMSLDSNGSTLQLHHDVTYYDVAEDFEVFESDGEQGKATMYASVYRALWTLLRRKPDLSTIIFNGELARIVLDRDLLNLEQFLTSSTLNWRAQAFGLYGISILDLAVGWREGLQALSAVWTWDASCTFWLAFMISDKDSCHQILDSFFLPMNSCTFIRLMMDLIKADAMDWAQTVVKSHVRKRRDLAALGRQHLSPTDQKRLGLSTAEVTPLNLRAREVYDLLRKKEIQVPLALHPG
ncbi:hypothetical protein NEUTE1DRAFT_139321 [Neurospora tetrasperma FGSC 2508]|uniref:Fungal N-terminal domain-containing protein n=1 Tax=Neurospora tetrasperma (strain FGSC 2508 / ATCC MYA-4615 / P0657) TaxID=510951 RepID=F8MSA0_NEUT8|nr:uncharacterized protein NEUTE1DRAFT_139321 [Neurospora tetrasperma FGSC 2508]EGO55041.1 hypothetical protein NEUTE1DRAFT_139321 [Neurospora tetrasperma FGSC 2508]